MPASEASRATSSPAIRTEAPSTMGKGATTSPPALRTASRTAPQLTPSRPWTITSTEAEPVGIPGSTTAGGATGAGSADVGTAPTAVAAIAATATSAAPSSIRAGTAIPRDDP